MRLTSLRRAARLGLVLSTIATALAQRPMKQSRLIVLDPGHFHAALVQKDMYPWLSDRVAVYAPLGPDVLDYLNRISLFNARAENPASWTLDVHTGPDFLARMLRERPGDVVVLTGRNRPKIERIRASLDAGLHVLADKPWIIRSSGLPQLERVLDDAARKRLIAYDIMTERFEITSLLQRELVGDPAVFGSLTSGTAASPAIDAKSVHHLMKPVAGVPIRRPPWFFDIDEYGEGLADVGTHVVDLIQWTAFPDISLDYRKDVTILDARHWPTAIALRDFQSVTGEAAFPPSLAPHIRDGKLDYLCNNRVHYTVRGVHVKLDILWNWEAPPGGGDIYQAVFRGSSSRIELRQGKETGWLPELYVVPNTPDQAPQVFAALDRRIHALQAPYPGLAVRQGNGAAHVLIPEQLRNGHEAHFAQVTNKFFQYLNAPESLPAWERNNMLVKYFICTTGVELARPLTNP